MSNAAPKNRKRRSDYLGALLLVVLSPLIIVAIASYLLTGLSLHLAIWCCWCSRGRYALFVYSDSPIWQEYIEEHMLPRLGEHAVVLNWSHRKRWRSTLAVLAFRYFGGHREFNPMAVVFRPFHLTRRFRFYEPFRAFKHGRTEAVTKMERELCDLVDRIAEVRAA